jgi:hypothetical protein
VLSWANQEQFGQSHTVKCVTQSYLWHTLCMRPHMLKNNHFQESPYLHSSCSAGFFELQHQWIIHLLVVWVSQEWGRGVSEGLAKQLGTDLDFITRSCPFECSWLSMNKLCADAVMPEDRRDCLC